MKYFKIITLTLGLFILSGLVFVGVANAQSFKTGNSISVPATETINSMSFAGGNNIDISGIVNGDVYCGGRTITISGTINGDVICGGQTINISGKISGSVRLGGQSVTISGSIGNSATIGAQDLIIEKSAVIERDLLGGSQNVTINGTIGRDMMSGANALTVNGTIGRDIKGGFESLAVGSAGLIGGKVDYIGTNDPIVQSGGKIVGKVTRTAPKEQTTTTYNPVAFAISWFIYAYLAMIILALVIAGLFPRTLEEASLRAMKAPGKTALIGTVAIILTPALIVLLMITAVGIPLAILTILTWIVIMILCTPLVGYMLGTALFRNTNQKPVWIMLLGASVLIVTYFVPIIGCVMLLASYIFGTGMILSQGQHLTLRPAVKK